MSAIREAVTSTPLYWPPGLQRTRRPERSRFGPTSVHRETQEVLAELGRMNVWDFNVIVSTNLQLRRDGLPYSNQKTPSDTGAAVWFTLKKEERVLACDRWNSVEDNLRAIAKHIDAIRAQDRWGVGSLEQSFRGYTALPAGDEARGWAVVLGIEPGVVVTRALVDERFKKLATERHPDHGGTDEQFAELATARKQAITAAGGA